MFFFLSKLLTFLISPTVIVLSLLVAALIIKKAATRRRLLITSLVLLFLFSNPFIINQLLKQWELKGVRYNKKDRYDAGIVLSGFMNINKESKSLSFGEGVDRLTEGLILYRKGFINKIIISGGSGSIVEDTRESALAKAFLVNYCAIPDSAVLIDTLSRNTYENAVESRKIMKEHNIKTALLITSASHMRRARACFIKAGLDVAIYSTDQRYEKQEYSPSDLIIPATDNLVRWEILMHEVAGCFIYKLKGYN